jgi:hypothetical protein
MAVPKTSMDKDDFSSGGEHKIWAPWKIASMQPVAISTMVKEAPNSHFGPSVLSPDGLHDPLTLLTSSGVSHRRRLILSAEPGRARLRRLLAAKP